MAKNKRKVPMKFRINLPIYHTSFQMYLSREALLEDVNQGDFIGDTWGACVDVAETEDGIPFVCLAFRDDDFMTAPIMAHECVHAAWAILKLSGVKVKAENHEALAYLVEYLFREVSEYVAAYQKQKGKKK